MAHASKEEVFSPKTVIDNEDPIVRTGLKKIRAIAMKNRVPFLVVIYPHFIKSYDGSWFKQSYISVQKILQEMSIPYIDLLPAFPTETIESYRHNPEDEVHPNWEGHFIAAKEIIRQASPFFGIPAGKVGEIMSTSFAQEAIENFPRAPPAKLD